MYHNYLITALRNLLKYRQFTLINIGGLAIGLAAALLISLHVEFERSYDRFQPHAQHTLRVVIHLPHWGVSAARLSPAIYPFLKRLSGVEDVFGLVSVDSKIDPQVNVDGHYFNLKHPLAATGNLRNFVDIAVVQGDLDQALNQPDTIALSASEALRLFGKDEVVGRILKSKPHDWKVAAVFADLPKNTHFAFNSLVAAKPFSTTLYRHDAYTYLRLTKDADKTAIASQIADFINRLPGQKEPVEIRLQALPDVYLAPNLPNDMKLGASQTSVHIYIALSLLLLLIAASNFINMSIAQAGLRAREVGVRKTLGASILRLRIQFLIESILLTLLAALLATVLVELALPVLNELADRKLTTHYWSQYGATLLWMALGVGVLAGAYPAVFISSFSAHRVLGGDFAHGKTAISVRKSLLVLQSALSIGLIIAAATVYLQLDFLRNLPVGYARTARLKVSNVETEKTFAQNSLGLFRVLEKIPGVLSATPVDIDLTEKQNAGIVQIRIPGQQQKLDWMGYAGVGYDAAQTLGLELLAGRDFSPQHPGDWFKPSGEGAGASKAAAALLITQSALISAGYQDPEQALGKIWTFNAGRYAQMQGRIVGVVRDIQIGASGAPRFPVVFGCGLSWTDKSSIMIHSNTPFSPHLHQQIRRLLGERLGLKLIDIESMDEKYSALYQRHKQLARVIAWFSGLAVFLTCIGVLGLAAHTAQRRSREIAMRKLLGASRLAIINLLAGEYLRLIGIGLLMAFPLAFVLMSDWLSQFSDRIGQSSITYLMALALVTGVTWLTISGVAFRTASARPSRVLHYE